MQQRQPRLGDILDDYCPRERRLTNHAVVAMIGDAVKQTRCTTCESEHEYKQARVPRQRRKPEQSALYSQVLANVTPRKSGPVADTDSDATDGSPAFDAAPPDVEPEIDLEPQIEEEVMIAAAPDVDELFELPSDEDAPQGDEVEEGPAHRRLIRAQLPRHEGQVSTTRQAPDFTIRQPNNPRNNRFRGRNQRGAGGAPFQGAQFQGNRGGGSGNGNGNGNGNAHGRGGAPRPGGRPHGSGGSGGSRGPQGPGRNRSK
jgi:hypothetical protein